MEHVQYLLWHLKNIRYLMCDFKVLRPRCSAVLLLLSKSYSLRTWPVW